MRAIVEGEAAVLRFCSSSAAHQSAGAYARGSGGGAAVGVARRRSGDGVHEGEAHGEVALSCPVEELDEGLLVEGAHARGRASEEREARWEYACGMERSGQQNARRGGQPGEPTC